MIRFRCKGLDPRFKNWQLINDLERRSKEIHKKGSFTDVLLTGTTSCINSS